MRAKIGLVWLSIAGLLATAAHAQGQKAASTFADWVAYTHEDTKSKICFIASQPKSQEPKSANRDQPHFYVSAWPKDGVKTEVSVKIGYPFKKGSEATVTVGSASFKLFTQAERAFVGDPTQELKLIDAMKKGSSLQVQGTSERGTSTTDSYSLSGFAQALQALAGLCQ
jgi:invasion protein IalB